MVCPCCDTILKDISVVGFDDSFRCGKCGSFGMEPWVVNQVVEKELGELKPIGYQAIYSGSWKCPRDQGELLDVGGDDIPKGSEIKKCEKCNWWWFMGDSLFAFKKAYQDRQEAIHLWSKKSEKTMLVLPAIFTVVLAVGLVVGLKVSRTEQNPQVGAVSGVSGFGGEYVGGGEEQVYFRSDKDVFEISYQKTGDTNWLTAIVTRNGGLFTADLKYLDSASEYKVRVGDQEYRFVTGK